ncbi:DUF7134 domain-containing protein [Nonomuraea sp. LPB2021202275-12-8]|uniref:DUF7134 domain-containing protein n=1 Tax=Nonomuraea sp. LPB2021202275-12-8 TaxID=3120159 RepID=UPI003FA5AFDF
MIAARRVGRAVDAGLAVGVVLATVGPLLLPDPKPWWIIGLGLLASVPVWWRRRAPIVVAVVVGAAMSVMVTREKPFLPFGPLLAVYTIADLSPTWKRLAAIPVIVAAVGSSLVLPGENDETFRLVGTAFVAAYALGTSAGRAARELPSWPSGRGGGSRSTSRRRPRSAPGSREHLGGGGGADLPGRLDAVHARHVHVHEDHVRPRPIDSGPRPSRPGSRQKTARRPSSRR